MILGKWGKFWIGTSLIVTVSGSVFALQRQGGLRAWKKFLQAAHFHSQSPAPKPVAVKPILKPDAQHFVQGLARSLSTPGKKQMAAAALTQIIAFEQAYQRAQENPSQTAFTRLTAANMKLKALRQQIGSSSFSGASVPSRVIALMDQLSNSVPASNSALTPLPKSASIRIKAESFDQTMVAPNGIFSSSQLQAMDASTLTGFSSSTSSQSGTCTPGSLSNPDPNGSSLTSSDVFTQQSPKVVQLAQRLQTPQAAFQFVRDQIKFMPRFGAAQTADQVLSSGVGSSADKASLLIPLLRAQGIAAQYVMGELQLSESQIENIFGLVAVGDLFWAEIQFLSWYFVNSQGAFDPTLLRYSANGNYIYPLPEIWVRAFINGQWTMLDPQSLPHDLQLASSGLTASPVETNLNNWFFRADITGSAIKAGTLADDLMRRTGTAIQLVSGFGTSLSDVGVVNEGTSVAPVSQDLPTSLPGVLPPCIEAQADSLPQSYQFLSRVQVGPSSSPSILVTIPSAQIRQAPLALVHSSGLLGEGAKGTGYLELKLGSEILAQTPMTVGTSVQLDNSIIFPSRYSKAVLDRTTPNVFAGEVQVIHHVLAPVFESDLDDEIASILTLEQASGTNHTDLMVHLLRLAGLMAAQQGEVIRQELGAIRDVGGSPIYEFTTGTVNGQVLDANDRDLGLIPLGSNIDLPIDLELYPLYGNNSSYGQYSNVTNYMGEFIASASSLEHQIWEELYGVPSISTVRFLQEGADAILHKKVSLGEIQGESLSPSNAPKVFAQFGAGMRSFIPLLQGYESQSPLLYALTDTLHLTSGWSGVGMFLFPTNPSGPAAALIATTTNPILASDGGSFDPMDPVLADNTTSSDGSSSSDSSTSSSSDTSSSTMDSSTLYSLSQGGTNVGAPVNQPSQTVGQALNSPSNATGCKSGQPVVLATGTMWHEFQDFFVSGRTPNTGLPFKRVYMTKPFATTGDLGPNWVHNWDTRLVLAASSLAPAQSVFWVDEQGGEWLFTKGFGNAFNAPPGQFATLTLFSDHYELRKPNGVVMVFSRGTPEPFGRLRSITDPHGETVSVTYQNGMLNSVTSPFAGAITFGRNAQGRITSVIRVRENFSYQFQYDAQGRLASSTDFLGRVTSYTYNSDQMGTAAQGLLATITDPIGRKIQFTYYDDGRAYQQFEPGNANRTYIYAPFLVDRFTRVLETDGSTTEFDFDTQFRTTQIIAADTSHRELSWTPKNQLLSQTDELGDATIYGYDSQGNLASILRPGDPRPTQISYDPSFNLPIKIVPLASSEIDLTRDPNSGDLLKIQRSDGTAIFSYSMTYDSFGNPISFTNDRGSHSNQTDSNGLLTRVFDSRNPETRSYDNRGRLIKRVFQSGRVLSYQYDNLDQLIRLDDSAGPSMVQTFDTVNRLISRTITDGKTQQTTQYEWDDRDRLIAVTDAQGNKTQIQYNPTILGCHVIDQPSSITDPLGRVTQFQYDSLQRLTRVTDARDGTTRYEYNLRGDLIALTDASGNRTQFRKDEKRRPILIEQSVAIPGPNGGPAVLATNETHMSYDLEDRLIHVDKGLPGNNLVLSAQDFQYDLLGRLIQKTQTKVLNGAVTSTQESAQFTYEPQLFPVQLISANNETASEGFSYEALPPYAMTSFSLNSTDSTNPLNLMEGLWNITPSQTAAIGSIADANQRSRGGFLSYQYDLAGRMTSVNAQQGNRSFTINLAYDSFGRKVQLSSMAGGDDTRGSFSYDLLNRITSIEFNSQGPDSKRFESLTYNPASEIIGSLRDLGKFSYGYDATSELTSVGFAGRDQRGGDDPDSKLANLLNASWGYDPTGNRISDSVRGAGVFLANQIISDSLASYSYDSEGHGNLVQKTIQSSDEVDSYSYRVDGKMVSFQKVLPATEDSGQTTVQAQYSFDALGRRIAKKVVTLTTSTEDSDDDNTVYQSYVYLGLADQIFLGRSQNEKPIVYLDRLGAQAGIDEHLGQLGPDGGQAYATDHLGSVLNNVEGFDAWGNILGTHGESLKQNQPVIYAFTGRQFDPESGLYYYRARMYDPGMGRFLEQDPMGFGGGDTNFYRSLRNSPLMYLDSSGLCTYQLGVYVSGGAGWGWAISGGIAIGYNPSTGTRSWGFFGSVGSGAYVGYAGSAGVQVGYSNNPDVSSLKGPSLDVGGSVNGTIAGLPVSVGGTVSIPAGNSSPTYWGSVGVGPGTPSVSMNVGGTGIYQPASTPVSDVYGPPPPPGYIAPASPGSGSQ